MLQSYVAVYYGIQNCSYHSTTVRLVQPNAFITYPSMNNSPYPQKQTTSLGSSPHKLGKTDPKHMRTIGTRDLTKQIPDAAADNNDNLMNPCPLLTTLTFEMFLENLEESQKEKHLV